MIGGAVVLPQLQRLALLGSQFPVLLEIKNKLPITISVSCQYNAKAFKTHLGFAWTDTVIAETTLAKDLISQGIFHNSDFN